LRPVEVAALIERREATFEELGSFVATLVYARGCMPGRRLQDQHQP